MPTVINGTTGVSQVQDGAITSTKIVDGTITDADISNTAAISGAKINPNFGNQTVSCTLLSSAALNDGDTAVFASNLQGLGSISLRPDGTNGNVLRWGGAGTNAAILRFLRTADVEVLRIQNGQLQSPGGQAFYGTVTNNTANQGAIMESGSNTNGSYIRYANGVQICWRSGLDNPSTSFTWNFPAAFSTNPSVVATMNTVSARFASAAVSSSSAATIARWTETGATSTVTVHVVATGNWY